MFFTDSESDCEILVSYITLKMLMKKKKQRHARQIWMAEWLKQRNREGAFHKLFPEILGEDEYLYRNIIRMTPTQFQSLLEKVTPLIEKKVTNFRAPISAAERLQVTLRYLATGETQSSLQLLFRIKQNTISGIIAETVIAIYNVLAKDYLTTPRTSDAWQRIIDEFHTKFGFPNCIGALDGKLVKIMGSKYFGSNYRGYKGDDAIMLFALADANCRFVFVDVGANGRVGDAGLWNNHPFKYAIEDNLIGIPPSQCLPNTLIEMPTVTISDDAFSLSIRNLKPFPNKNLSEDQLLFNYMLSRNRRVVECAFGILARTWQVLFSKIWREPVKATQIVLALVALHNFVREDNIRQRTTYDMIADDEIDRLVSENYENIQGVSGRQSSEGKTVREAFKIFFVSKRRVQ